MMRFYHLSDREVLDMPISRFLVLYRQIPILEAEEELRALAVAHTSDPRRRAETLQRQLRGTTVGERATMQAVETVPGIQYEREAGSIAAEHERQRAAAAAIERAWREQHAVRADVPSSPSA